MHISRHAVPVTVVHATCDVCGTLVCVVAMGFVDEQRIKKIRDVTPFCEECFGIFSLVEHIESNPWQDEFSTMEGINDATHQS